MQCGATSCNATGGDCFEGKCVCRPGFAGGGCGQNLFGVQLAALPGAQFPPPLPPSPLPPLPPPLPPRPPPAPPQPPEPPPRPPGPKYSPLPPSPTRGELQISTASGLSIEDFLLRGQGFSSIAADSSSSSAAQVRNPAASLSTINWIIFGALCAVFGVMVVLLAAVLLVHNIQTRSGFGGRDGDVPSPGDWTRMQPMQQR